MKGVEKKNGNTCGIVKVACSMVLICFIYIYLKIWKNFNKKKKKKKTKQKFSEVGRSVDRNRLKKVPSKEMSSDRQT
jgi:hypothetical protein